MPAVKGWIDHSSHRQNIEGNFDRTGIGGAVNDNGEYYFFHANFFSQALRNYG